MGPASIFRETWEAIPVLILLFVGSMIALKSGSQESSTGRTLRQFFANFYQMALRITGYVAVLLALQYWIGMRPLLGW